MANQIEIEIVLEDGSISKGLVNLKKKSEKAGKESGKKFGSGFGGAAQVAIGSIAAQGIVKTLAAIRDQIGGVVKASTSLETFRTQFATILGSTQAAEKQLKSLQEFAATTPFQLPGLTESTRQLLSFGVAQEEIIPTLRQLGDLAAGTGSEIQDLTIPFGRLVSTQKLTLVELDKFADRGINLYGKLSEQTGISLKNIRDEVSKGRIPFEEFTKALNDLTSEGGTFFGATEAQSKTLSGLFSTLSDNFFNLQASLGDVFGPFLKVALQNGITLVQDFTKAVRDNQGLIIDGFFDVLESLSFLGQGAFIVKNAFQNTFSLLRSIVADFVASVFDGLQTVSQFASSIGLDLPFKDVLDDLAETTAQTAEELNFSLSEFTANDFFGEEFREQIDLLIERFRAAGEAIPAELSKVQTAIKTTKTVVNEGLGEAAKEAAKNAQAINRSISSGLARGLSATIQKLASNLATGKSIFADFGSFVLNIIGDLAIQIGQAAIGIGLAIQAIGNLSGTQALIAGAGLVALGTIIKSFAGGGGGLPDAGSGGFAGGAGIAGGFTPTGESILTDEEDRAEPETRIAVNIQGDVLDSEESGLRIVQLINDAFDRDGAIVTG